MDLTQPIALVLNDRRLGPVTIGWIMPGEVDDPCATTIPLTHHTEPLPGHESWHQPADRATEAGIVAGEADDVGGSDAGAEIHPASWAGGVLKDALGGALADAGDVPDTVSTSAYDLAMSRRQADTLAAAQAVTAGQSNPDTAPQPGTIAAKSSQRDVPPPIDVASLPPGPLGPADYERAATRNRYLAGLYDPESAADRAFNLMTGAMSDPANVLTPSERAEHLALNAKFRETIVPTPTPQEARLDTMLASPLGTAASVAVGTFGGSQRSQDDALATVAMLEGVGLAVGGSRAGEASEFLNAQSGQNLAKPPISRLNIQEGRQNIHRSGTREYVPSKSTLTADPRALVDHYAGKGSPRGPFRRGEPGFREVFDTGGEIIGIYRDKSGREAATTRGTIHYSKTGAHIVPAPPNGWVQ